MPSTPGPDVDGAVVPSRVIVDSAPLFGVDGCHSVVLPVWPGRDDEEGPWVGDGADVVQATGADLFGAVERARKPAAAGTVTPVALPRGVGPRRALLVGLGDGTPDDYRQAGAAVGRALRGEARAATTLAATADDAALRALVEGLVLAPFAWRRATTPVPAGTPVGDVVLAETGAERLGAVGRGLAVARAGWLARELAVTPSDTKDPAWVAARAVAVAADSGLGVTVLDETALADGGFGGLLAVGAGSVRPPRLVELTYAPAAAGASAPHVVLVGKGITFDTGGLSLKPREAMVPMKTDMTGAAVVLAVLSALRDLGIGLRVTGLLALAENMPGGAAQRPGDVLRQYDGTTVEVVNTDAEGRLVLADALAYAAEQLRPDVLVDVATLTGAASLGLGRRHAALFTADDPLAEALTVAGAAAGERLWRLPLVDDYRDALRSEVADLCHVATEKVSAGAITAALFLEHFTGACRWAHLDIAGPGRADADEHEVTKGGTGFGARALLYWLETADPLRRGS
ncbi:MAG TPA: leucyl aminopeptidase [Jiangellales bacterium]|nr:leucyl aminopeptidase [Jiangellales bacterium]